MKFLKIFFIFFFLIFLNGCLQTTALLGPGITIATTGNVLQAGFQYGADTVIEKETGKKTFEHFQSAIEDKKKNKEFKEKFTNLVEKKFKLTRKKIKPN